MLVLIYPRRGRLHLVLTLRTSKVDHHRDQVSFPGGKKDGQETISEAALREAAEELGVPAAAVRVLGQLTPLYVAPSNFCIYPVVAAAEKRPRFRPAPAEDCLDLDADRATVRAMFYNPMRLPGMTDLSYCGGYYHHHVVRTADGWRSERLVEENAWFANPPEPPAA